MACTPCSTTPHIGVDWGMMARRRAYRALPWMLGIMLGRSKSSGHMLADPKLLSLLELHFRDASLQADGMERGKAKTMATAYMEGRTASRRRYV